MKLQYFFCDFGRLVVLLLARKFCRVHENTSWVVAGSLRLLSWAPDALTHHTPHLEHASILQAIVACEAVALGVVLSHVVYQNIRSFSRTAAP